MEVIKNCSESEVIQELRKYRNKEVKIQNSTVYRLSYGKQFEGEVAFLSKENNLKTIFI